MTAVEIVRIENYLIPVKYTVERRRNVRASIGRTAVNVRLPAFLDAYEKVRYAKQMKDWVHQKFKENKDHFAVFKRTTYTDGQKLILGDKEYTIKLTDQLPNLNHFGDLKRGVIHLRIQQKDQDLNKEKAIRSLVSKLVADDQYFAVSSRISALNQLHFQHQIYDIKIKHNLSNWGSCSTNGIINISSRLLFAPSVVRDYVYIHELAHLNHMNHSADFWNVVASVMPEYKIHERWLKDNSANCQF